MIDSLERRGLVTRRAVAHDRRSNALELTPAGVTLLKTLKRRVAAHEKRLARDLERAGARDADRAASAYLSGTAVAGAGERLLPRGRWRRRPD